MDTLNPDDKSAVSSDSRESRDLNHANITNILDPGHKKASFLAIKLIFDTSANRSAVFLTKK